MPESEAPEYSYSDAPTEADDASLVARLARSYRIGHRDFAGHGTSFWASFEERHKEFKDAFDSDDLSRLTNLLRDPSCNELFWGFDSLNRVTLRQLREEPSERERHARSYYGAIVQVAIGTGAIRCPYPESGQETPTPSVEQTLLKLDETFGFKIDFPNPFRHEFGLVTSRGIASYRSIQALYQAWRIDQILRVLGGGRRVLEIGAGLGRTAYYVNKFGPTEYTIIDIPITQLAQGYFLGRVIDEGVVSLYGENDAQVRLRSPHWLHGASETFDIVLNVDSLTELDRIQALDYVKFAREKSMAFLSVNHEFNPTPVSTLLAEAGMIPISRSPYWPRSGYVEELVLADKIGRRRPWSGISGYRAKAVKPIAALLARYMPVR